MLKKELDLKVSKSYFWSDSMAVLGYIRNKDKKFDVFVANRLARIHDVTAESQWNYVPTNENPADDASRGIKAKALNGRWLTGPEFLSKDPDDWPRPRGNENNLHCNNTVTSKFDDGQNENVQCCADVCQVNANQEETLPLSIRDLLDKYSSYYKLKRTVAWLYKICKGILSKRLTIPAKVISVEDLELAEKAIVRCVQKQHFKPDIQALKHKKCLPK